MVTVMVADPSAHAPVAYNYEKRCHFSWSPISDVKTVDKGKAAVNGQFSEENVELAAIFLLKVARSCGFRDIYRIFGGFGAPAGPRSAGQNQLAPLGKILRDTAK